MAGNRTIDGDRTLASQRQIEQSARVRRWELWSGDDGHTFFPEENERERQMAQADGYVLTWETMAQSMNCAHRALYAYLGWGEFKPMLRPDGTPYPEDEDDDYVPS
jgi:hypothetical protein